MKLGYRHTSIAPSRSAGSGGKKAKARAKGSQDGPLPEPHGRLRRHGQQARAAPAALQDAQEATPLEQGPPDAARAREDAQVIIET